MKKSILTMFSQKLAMFALVCGVLVATSCTKKSDPAPATVATVALPSAIVGKTYTGDVSYTGAVIRTAAGDGKVTITETGTNTYTISFSVPSGVPSLTGVQFTGNGSYASVSASGSVSGITITERALDFGITKDGATWTVSANR